MMDFIDSIGGPDLGAMFLTIITLVLWRTAPKKAVESSAPKFFDQDLPNEDSRSKKKF